MLDERCDIALGVGFEHRFLGMDESFEGVAFVGYHAMDKTIDGVMCRSFSRKKEKQMPTETYHIPK